jgi:hypothetical protein
MLFFALGMLGRQKRLQTFVENIDPNNKYQAPRDAELMPKIKTDDIRNAFIRMLI